MYIKCTINKYIFLVKFSIGLRSARLDYYTAADNITNPNKVIKVCYVKTNSSDNDLTNTRYSAEFDVFELYIKNTVAAEENAWHLSHHFNAFTMITCSTRPRDGVHYFCLHPRDQALLLYTYTSSPPSIQC